MKSFILAAAVAAATLTTIAVPEADARRGFGGGGFRHAGFHGGGFRHHRHFRVGYVAPVYASGGYCRWYRTPYGNVRRCFY